MNQPDGKSIIFGEQNYTLDNHGFLDPPEQWDDNFANGMARLQGIYDGLTDEHWNFLRYIRLKFSPYFFARTHNTHLRLRMVQVIIWVLRCVVRCMLASWFWWRFFFGLRTRTHGF